MLPGITVLRSYPQQHRRAIRPRASYNTITIVADYVTLDSDVYAVYYCGRAIVPGSLTIGGSNGNYQDEGGVLGHVSGSNLVDASTVDYTEGVVRIRYSGS